MARPDVRGYDLCCVIQSTLELDIKADFNEGGA
jgi:hypothetical protein